MNRHERRATAGRRFVAKCPACEAKTCPIHVLVHAGKKQPGICKGCPCAVGKCDSCGHTGEHWLGCSTIGLAEFPPDGALQ